MCRVGVSVSGVSSVGVCVSVGSVVGSTSIISVVSIVVSGERLQLVQVQGRQPAQPDRECMSVLYNCYNSTLLQRLCSLYARTR